MVIVTGTITVAATDRAAMLAGWETMRAATLAEDGCIAYDLWVSRHDENSFRLYEEWETMPHLEAHFQTAHMAAYKERGASLDRTAEIVRHEVSATSAL